MRNQNIYSLFYQREYEFVNVHSNEQIAVREKIKAGIIAKGISFTCCLCTAAVLPQ